jgi:hypothetical protein
VGENVRIVFFSWQSDIKRAICRDLIKECLDQAVSELNAEVHESDRFRVDSDTQNVPGTPEILATILEKIDASHAFVADLTFIGQGLDGEKWLPNPNVLIEYGYALKSLGRTRVVGVKNDAFGSHLPTALPFDLRHARGPLRYRLAPDANVVDRTKVRDRLRADLLSALSLIPARAPTNVVDLIPAESGDPSRFVPVDSVIATTGDFGEDKNVLWTGSRSSVYVKFFPTTPAQLRKSQIERLTNAAAGLEIGSLSGLRAGSHTVNTYGFLSYALENNRGVDQVRLISDLAQYFENGAIWLVSGSFLGDRPEFSPTHLKDLLAKMCFLVRHWITAAQTGGGTLELGATGLDGKRILGNRGQIDGARKIHGSSVIERTAIEKTDQLQYENVIRAFMEKLFDSAGLDYNS